MEEDCMVLTKSSGEKNKQWQRQQIQVKISTIFKYKVTDTPQAFGSFFNSDGEKYCAISVLSKYLGYDIAAAASSKKSQNDNKNMNPAELIPYSILEIIENFTIQSNLENHLRCFCSIPDYYYCFSLISMLIHLNDYHKMTFSQIGNWLESKGM
jgi:hypothetical protein